MISFDTNPATAASNTMMLNEIRDMHLDPNLRSLLKDENGQLKELSIPIENTEVSPYSLSYYNLYS